MESYRFVKREGKPSAVMDPDRYLNIVTENIRRVFHRWFSLARTTRHRRLILQQKEDDVKFSIIAVAWEKWRDLYNDEKLRPIVRLIPQPPIELELMILQEYNVATQTQKNLLFWAFGMWHSKTKVILASFFSDTQFLNYLTIDFTCYTVPR